MNGVIKKILLSIREKLFYKIMLKKITDSDIDDIANLLNVK